MPTSENNFRCLAAESITILDVIPPDIIVSARSPRTGGHEKRNIATITRLERKTKLAIFKHATNNDGLKVPL